MARKASKKTAKDSEHEAPASEDEVPEPVEGISEEEAEEIKEHRGRCARSSYLWVQLSATAGDVFLHFLLPTLAGNVVGGTVLFAVLSYAQVREEISSGDG